MCIPFVIWSQIYSALTLIKNIYNGAEIRWNVFVYRFIIGKAATPFYYIVVLIQLTVITPWLVKIVKGKHYISKVLWFVTPTYLLYVYVWNFITGTLPRLYETFFPAWFGFYYLGIQVRFGLKLKCRGYMVGAALLISCVEALVLKNLGLSMGFYTSQITIGSFLYSILVIGWILNKHGEQERSGELLAKIGDCSYGIFYIHMMVLMIVEKFIDCENWYVYWGLKFVLTAVISFGVVRLNQKWLKHYHNILNYVGFI